MRRLLLVGVGLTGRPYAAAARRLGMRVHAVETEARAAALASEVDEVTVCRGGSDELWYEAAAMAVRTARPDGVLAFSEPHVLAAALVQDELGLPGPSLRAAAISRNKALQRARFAAAGIGQPEHLVTDRLADAAGWAVPRLPVVVKPLSSAGSAGVELVADEAGFADVAARRAGEGRLLVERAVPGPEYSWEALVREGKAWFTNLTEKETSGPPYFVETGHRVPAPADAATRAAADDLGAAVLDALGMHTGIVHLEFRSTESGPSVMEVAVRTPGDRLMDLLGLAHGIDCYEAAVRMALGEAVPPPPPGPARHTAVHLLAASPGTVTAVHGLADVLAHPCVVEAEVSVAPGDVVAPVRSSAERVGQVLLAADDPDLLTAALADVRAALRVETRPAP